MPARMADRQRSRPLRRLDRPGLIRTSTQARHQRRGECIAAASRVDQRHLRRRIAPVTIRPVRDAAASPRVTTTSRTPSCPASTRAS
jgi:hypothetical protein